jgi:hypothetical protein
MLFQPGNTQSRARDGIFGTGVSRGTHSGHQNIEFRGKVGNSGLPGGGLT